MHPGGRYELGFRLDAPLQIVRLMWVSDAFVAQGGLPAEAASSGTEHGGAVAAGAPPGDPVEQFSIGDSMIVLPRDYTLYRRD